MTITPVETIALLVSIAIILKLVMFSVNKNSLVKMYDQMFSRNICSLVYAVLAGVVLYFLLQELTIVQIVASMAFVSLLGAIGVMMHVKGTKKMVKKTVNAKISWVGFLMMMVMIVIASWAIYEVLLSAGWI